MNIFTLHLRFQNCLSGVAVSLLTSIMDYSKLDSRFVQAKVSGVAVSLLTSIMDYSRLYSRYVQAKVSGVAVSLLTSIMDYSRLYSRYVQAKHYYPFCILLIQYLLLL